MFKFEFILPSVYGLFVSCLVIKLGMFNVNMNLLTWMVYFFNVFIAYLLYKLGEVLDKCLERLL